ncbi:cupin domain-containing protein [Rhodobacteraceae bacterium nBUS_24]|jgi:mannose-6-phosphate isomerase-like protein (cupin superfamily)|nr:cupin domain-containing protein [Marinovum sp.]MBT7907452.1 cupin domain-containing protein [Marinovum sp.]
MAEIFIQPLAEAPWQNSSPERIKIGANPNTRWRLLVDATHRDSHGLSVGYGKIPVGEDLPLHSHAPQEVYFITQGNGLLLMKDEKVRDIAKGDSVYIPENEPHGVKNTGTCDLEFLFVFPGDSWSEIEYNFKNKP